MTRTGTIIIGGGQAGLALSRCLTDRHLEHVVLEKGRIAQSWSERWQTLRLLSPNWMTRLPGAMPLPDADSYMTRDEVVATLRDYARSFDAPVREKTEVKRVRPEGRVWIVEASRGTWIAENVVIATGHNQLPNVPAFAKRAPGNVAQVTTNDYRSPEQFPRGGVLVVGASASGVQLARELRQSGREVIVSVGSHTRLPRRYRGRDILYWLDRLGAFDRPITDMPDPRDAMREPSLQLAGSDDGMTLDLAVLASEGVRLAGRLEGFDGERALFADDLAESTAAADEQLRKLLERIDRHIDSHGITGQPSPDEFIRPVPVDSAPRELDLEMAGITGILWATGYKRAYPWLEAPVIDEHGEILQVRGCTPAIGLYVLGLQFMIRRSSSFLHGVGRDAEEIAARIALRAARNREEAA